jgi:hypothetical protein
MQGLMLRLDHRHNDGSWSSLEPRSVHHDPSAHDPEGDWADGEIYVCTTCDEQVRVRHDGGEAPSRS